MVDPVAIHQIAGAALLGGGIVLCGAGYAIFHALAGLSQTRRRAFVAISLGCYVALAGCVAGFAIVLNLGGWWLVLVALLLICYFLAPRFIWRLSVAVHRDAGQGVRAESEV